MSDLPIPIKGAKIFEDAKLYAALANRPITKGHTVVVWKPKVADLHMLKYQEYEYLMEIVDRVRDALLKTLGVEKVYLVYMDEVKHVHWHLIPRYNEQGFNVLSHVPSKLQNTALAGKIKRNFSL